MEIDQILYPRRPLVRSKVTERRFCCNASVYNILLGAQFSSRNENLLCYDIIIIFYIITNIFCFSSYFSFLNTHTSNTVIVYL